MDESIKDIAVIHTDGGCRPNPGPGGWGAVLRQRQHVRGSITVPRASRHRSNGVN
jgi:ribonuclease HI